MQEGLDGQFGIRVGEKRQLLRSLFATPQNEIYEISTSCDRGRQDVLHSRVAIRLGENLRVCGLSGALI
jgi:hypothetical protein